MGVSGSTFTTEMLDSVLLADGAPLRADLHVLKSDAMLADQTTGKECVLIGGRSVEEDAGNRGLKLGRISQRLRLPGPS